MRREIRSYVLRKGRITKLQERALETLSDRYCIPFEERPLDFAALFPGKPEIVAEIGFGNGLVTAEIAQARATSAFLGIEVFRPGVGKLLAEIEARSLSNVRVVCHDAVQVLAAMIPDGSLSGVHIFFPDPWPKKRHHKRRLIQADFASLVSGKIRTGGYLYVVTDWEDYAFQILAVLRGEIKLVNRYDEFAETQAWRPTTRFEEKANGRPIRELYFLKKD